MPESEGGGVEVLPLLGCELVAVEVGWEAEDVPEEVGCVLPDEVDVDEDDG